MVVAGRGKCLPIPGTSPDWWAGGENRTGLPTPEVMQLLQPIPPPPSLPGWIRGCWLQHWKVVPFCMAAPRAAELCPVTSCSLGHATFSRACSTAQLAWGKEWNAAWGKLPNVRFNTQVAGARGSSPSNHPTAISKCTGTNRLDLIGKLFSDWVGS